MLRNPEFDGEDSHVADENWHQRYPNPNWHCIFSKSVLFIFGNLDPDLDGHTQGVPTGFFHDGPGLRAMLRNPDFDDEESDVADGHRDQRHPNAHLHCTFGQCRQHHDHHDQELYHSMFADQEPCC
jgi:hypothetical protein